MSTIDRAVPRAPKVPTCPRNRHEHADDVHALSGVAGSNGTMCSIAWRVRAGSISHPACRVWLEARKVSGGSTVLLVIAVAEGQTRVMLTTMAGETLNLLQLLEASGVEIRESVVSSGAGFVHAHVTATRTHSNEVIVILSASHLQYSTSDAQSNARYAMTQLWSLLEVPGGRYELASE